ncbi:MAG: serine protein kinase PrkA, partial [Myxococcales bacterium]|nr:serine protein kinase PrkA [Myxococcales bacterium]
RDLERDIAEEFVDKRHVLSFDEFFLLFRENPRQHSRSAAQYARDCLLHYGTEEVTCPEGELTRYRLFDAPWSGGAAAVVGQETAQNALFRHITSFIRERRVTRLVLFHGPNGSAKSSFIDCLGQALEHYSTLEEGAIYRFNWVFPSLRIAKKKLGFGAEQREGAIESYAHLDEEDVDARLAADLRDHPLLLLPQRRRAAILEELQASGRLGDEQVPEYLLDGDLSPRSRAIADALLASYHGDFQRLLQHVQVERFNFSRRYRQGFVTIEPQLHVDASLRQVTLDQALQSLPSALRTLSMFEPFGDLVDANRGIINYNDLLKKPVDAFKYLLATCEKGTVALPQAILHLDTLFLASSNEVHLRAFKEYPDWPSFKGRMDLVKMPYIRDHQVERRIYDEQIERAGIGAVVTPHATYVLALWAVLTRLRRPRAEAYPTSIRDVIARLTPLEKADLYAGTRLPRDLSSEQARDLKAAVSDLLAEGQELPDYEGSFGASPREMKQVLMNALQDKRHHGVSAIGILEELRELTKNKTVYEYLRIKPDGGFHDYGSFIEQVLDRYLDLVDGEIRAAMGLVSEQQYEQLFARYILNVSYALKDERLYNEATGKYDPPDAKLMDELERVWETPDDAQRFRRDLIARIGAYRVEHKGETIPYRRLFPKLIEALENDYYEKQKVKVGRMAQHLVTVLIADEIGESPT